MISSPAADAKHGPAYHYFLGVAGLSATDLPHQQTAYLFEQLNVNADDDAFLHIEDTFFPKTGNAIGAVAELYNLASSSRTTSSSLLGTVGSRTANARQSLAFDSWLSRTFLPSIVARTR